MTLKRVENIKRNLEKGEAFLVVAPHNRFYFTGFESTAGVVFITNEAAVLLIDFRYYEAAKAVVKSCEVVLSDRRDSEILELCEKYGVKKLYVEADETSIQRHKTLSAALSGVEVLSDDKFDRITEEMRMIKTEEELELMKKAQKLTDETFSYILGKIQPGKTEKEIMLDMEMFMRSRGSEGVAFDFIVVSGKNSSLPHGVPSDKVIEKGDFVTLDFGANVQGYLSDMTRTVAVGSVSDEQRRVYDIVLRAQEAALKEVKAGLVCRDVDKIARDIINGEGYEGCFGHGLGHSVGIKIHENPRFNTTDTTVLKPGMVMTVEPGIYLENRFGVRIEDYVYVTENGCINLTHSPKELIIL